MIINIDNIQNLQYSVMFYLYIHVYFQGYQLRGSVNGQLTFEQTIDKAPLSGFVGIGTSSYGIADFDNLNIFNTNQRKFISYEGETDINSETLYFVPRH